MGIPLQQYPLNCITAKYQIPIRVHIDKDALRFRDTSWTSWNKYLLSIIVPMHSGLICIIFHLSVRMSLDQNQMRKKLTSQRVLQLGVWSIIFILYAPPHGSWDWQLIGQFPRSATQVGSHIKFLHLSSLLMNLFPRLL